MSKNRELFEEAIADATAIKKMAIENAKKSIEESFTPHLTKMLSAKIQEIEGTEVAENVEEIEEIEEPIAEETFEEEINLDELLAELAETEIDEDINLDEAKKDEKKDEKKDDKKMKNLKMMKKKSI